MGTNKTESVNDEMTSSEEFQKTTTLFMFQPSVFVEKHEAANG